MRTLHTLAVIPLAVLALVACGDDDGTVSSASGTLTTSVTPSMRSRMMRSMPAFSVTVLVGQVPQAPTSVT